MTHKDLEAECIVLRNKLSGSEVYIQDLVTEGLRLRKERDDAKAKNRELRAMVAGFNISIGKVILAIDGDNKSLAKQCLLQAFAFPESFAKESAAVEAVIEAGLEYYALWLPDDKDGDKLHEAFNGFMDSLARLAEVRGEK